VQAEILLDNPIYQEAMSLVRDGIVERWEACPIRDIDGQHELKLMLKLLGDLQSNIKNFVDSGKLARIEIEEDKKIKEFKARNKFA
jgi:hypothetical protein